jgi:hypothetical protein
MLNQLKLLMAHIRYGLATGVFFRKRARYPKQNRDDAAGASLNVPGAKADEAGQGDDSIHGAKPLAVAGAGA